MPIHQIARRDVLAALGSAAAWPLVAFAQPSPIPTVGCLINGSRDDAKVLFEPFCDGLRELGFTEGENVAIECRWAEGHNERLTALAAELVRMPVAVIATLYGASAALAAKSQTTSIPIVFLTGGDAAALGLVANPDRPEANLTGVSGITNTLVALQIDLLRRLFPKARSFALLTNPASANAATLTQITQALAQSSGRELIVATARNEGELDQAFAFLAERQPGGVIVPSNAFFLAARQRLVELAAHYKLATIYDVREFVQAGGLASYGQSSDRFRQVGVYVGKILRGAKPADLPVVRPSKLELVVNRKTAKALGLDLPPAVLAQADAVIE
jgi:putative tryptophan/tyrosine transport system substrate-binding protein